MMNERDLVRLEIDQISSDIKLVSCLIPTYGAISNVSTSLRKLLKRVWYFMARSLGWDVIVTYPKMPDDGETVNGQIFSCPKGARTIGLHIGNLTGSSPTVKLQALDPVDKTT